MQEPEGGDYLLAIGVMTGNSLDGADLVLTRFDIDGTMEDLCVHGAPMPERMGRSLREVRAKVNEANGDMAAAVRLLDAVETDAFFSIERAYTEFVARAVRELMNKARADAPLASRHDLSGIDLIGSHGQTCAHCPPSIAAKQGGTTYTVQIGNAQTLADLTGVAVVSDFRSDDLMLGGEGAPLAPVHHRHIAMKARALGRFPLAFVNGGNTSNISVVSHDASSGGIVVVGWDAGPFNHFPDRLMQAERGVPCDQDGAVGRRGAINVELLSALFQRSVRTQEGDGFLDKAPPKSSDPAWYAVLPELAGTEPVGGVVLPFEDRVRTAEYFAAYIVAHTLSHLPSTLQIPGHFALCGGGWKNPVCREDFVAILNGDTIRPILPEHETLMSSIREAAARSAGGRVTVESSDRYGFDATAMEARIFADAAVCRIKGEPFTLPETTGAARAAVCGVIRHPQADEAQATPRLRSWLRRFKSADMTIDRPDLFDPHWSRATRGWERALSLC